jgi:uncharacterized protein (AIM24 family)
VSGRGQVVVVAQGDVEQLDLVNEKLAVDGTFVLARTGNLQYRVERATKSLFGSMSSGEGLISTFEGTGTVLLAPIPYWQLRMMAAISSAAASAAAASSKSG